MENYFVSQYIKLAGQAADIKQKFQLRRKKWRDKLLQPPTPTSGNFSNLR